MVITCLSNRRDIATKSPIGWLLRVCEIDVILLQSLPSGGYYMFFEIDVILLQSLPLGGYYMFVKRRDIATKSPIRWLLHVF